MEEVSYSMPAAASDSPSSGGGSVEAESCSICLEEFEAGERVQRLVCSHHFHSQVSVQHHHHPSCRQRLVITAGADPRCVLVWVSQCINEWLHHQDLCPNCRCKVLPIHPVHMDL